MRTLYTMEKNYKKKTIANIIWVAFLILAVAAIFLDLPYEDLYIGGALIAAALASVYKRSLKKNNKLKNSSWYYAIADIILLGAIIAVFSFHVSHATTIGVFIVIIAIPINYFISKTDTK